MCVCVCVYFSRMEGCGVYCGVWHLVCVCVWCSVVCVECGACGVVCGVVYFVL